MKRCSAGEQCFCAVVISPETKKQVKASEREWRGGGWDGGRGEEGRDSISERVSQKIMRNNAGGGSQTSYTQ